MKSLTLFKAAFAACVVSLLAACGGNDAPPVSNAAWASPAAFVPAGASSKSFNLSSCSMNESTLYNAALVISANGDASIQGSTTSTGAVTTLFSLAFAQATESSWKIEGTVEEPNIYVSVNQSTTTISKRLFFGFSSEEGGLDAYNNTAMQSISCNGISTVTLQISPDATRAANNLGTAAAVTEFDDDSTDGNIAGGNAFWDNGSGYGASNRSQIRFNLGTGALASATSTSATYTAISLALPTQASGDYGSYSEKLTRHLQEFDNKDAKTICLRYSSESQDFSSYLSATAYGNKFRPQASFSLMIGIESVGREAPQDISFGCNDYR
jgi:hypothetical protein